MLVSVRFPAVSFHLASKVFNEISEGMQGGSCLVSASLWAWWGRIWTDTPSPARGQRTSHTATSFPSRCSTGGWRRGRRPAHSPTSRSRRGDSLSSLSHLYNMSIKCLLCTRIGAWNFPDSLVSNHVRFISLFIDWLKTFGQHEPTELVLVCLLSCCQVDQCKPSWIFYSWAVSSLHNLMYREKCLLNIILLFISSVIK